jgi:hypothetical protein
MSTIEFSSTMVKTLKGAPLSVLILLAMAKTPLSAQYLERESGYSDKAVNSALLYLADHGLITRNGRYAWQIANGVKALPLMIEIEAPTEEIPESENVGAQTTLEEEITSVDSGSRRNSESEKFRLPVPSSSSSLTSINPKDLELPLLDAAESEKFRVDANQRACQDAGIGEPTRSTLSKLEHVTAQLIRYHANTAPNLALAIYRIRKGWKIKAGWEDDQQITQQTIEETLTEEPAEPLPENAVHAWEAALILLENQFRRVEYETWIKSLTLSWYGDSGYVLRTANKCGTDWLNAHALKALESALGSPVQIVWG